MAKRIFDIITGVLGSCATILLTPFVGLAIIIESGFPVFVALPRVSGGKIVRVYKFRSMVRDARERKRELVQFNERSDGPLFKMKDDPRLTKVGKALRKFRLDEFPQFFNVLSGSLSLVGPRPHEPEEINAYPPEFQNLRFAKAGLTGLSQVNGASSLPFRKELEYDEYYAEHVSLWLDVKILAKTVWIFFSDPTGV